jgi:hypothetical protein
MIPHEIITQIANISIGKLKNPGECHPFVQSCFFVATCRRWFRYINDIHFKENSMASAEINFSKAYTELRDYFVNPKNHRDKDVKHVSLQELSIGIRHYSPETKIVAEALVSEINNYQLLLGLQSEGQFNDGQVSLRDLYAAARGTGFRAEKLDRQIVSLNTALLKTMKQLQTQREIAVQRAEREKKWFEGTVEMIAANARELCENYRYSVSLGLRDTKSGGLLGDRRKDAALAKYSLQLYVGPRTYRAWSSGEAVSEDSGFLNTYQLVVEGKNREVDYYYQDLKGGIQPIPANRSYSAQTIFNAVLDKIKTTDALTPGEDSEYRKTQVRRDKAFAGDEVKRFVPLQRTLNTRRFEASLSYKDSDGDQQSIETKHDLEIEEPDPSWGQAPSNPGNLVSSQIFPDNRFFKVFLKDGRQIFVTRTNLQSLLRNVSLEVDEKKAEK